MSLLSRTSLFAALALVPAALVVGAPAAPAPPRPHAVAPHLVASALEDATAVAGTGSLSAADRDQAARRGAADLPAQPAASRAPARALAQNQPPVVLQASPVEPVGAPVVVVGVTWAQGTGQGATVQYRSRTGNRWSAWTFMDTDSEHGPDPGTAEGRHARAGSAPLALTGTNGVQVRVIGQVTHRPATPKVVVVDPGTSAADDNIGATAAGSAAAVTSRPSIYTRAQWGADESLRKAPPEYGAVKAAFVHHTVDSNTYTASQVPAIIRAIYAYHVESRGWNDIGYNFLIDKFGRIWEGRYGGVDRPVIGAHTLNYNSYSFGASAIGNYDIAAVPNAMTAAFERLIAWKAQIHEFNPAGMSNLHGTVIHSVSGHRDTYQTACPGRYLYAKLPTIRAGAAALLRGLPSLSIARDVDNYNHSDVLATNAAHDLLLYNVTGHGGLSGPVVKSSGAWSGVDLVTIPGDWTGDGAVDVLARQTSTGQLRLYAGNGSGGFRASTVVGVGWSTVSALVGPGDWSGDGHPDLLARMKDGTLRLYPGNGRGGFAASRQVGTGWNGMTHLSALGDWDADGHPDLLAVDRLGNGWLYRGTGTGGFYPRIGFGPGWEAFASVSALGDATSDTRTDLLAITKAGQAYIGHIGPSVGVVRWIPVAGDWSSVSVYDG